MRAMAIRAWELPCRCQSGGGRAALVAEERQGHDDKSRSATRAWAHDAVWRSGEDAGGKCSFDKVIAGA